MKNLFTNLLESSNERIKNPFISSFLISWIAFNWKPIFVLFFSENSIEKRIDFISTNYVDIIYQLYLPLIFTVFYILILPYLMLGIDYLISFAKFGRKKNLTQEKINDLRDKQKIAIEERIYEDKKAGNAEISELNSKISELTHTNEENQKLIGSLKLEIRQVKKEKQSLEQFISLDESDNAEFTPLQQEKLDNEYEEFIKTEDSSYFESIGVEISQFKTIPKKIDNLVIQRFLMRGLIKKVEDEESQKMYYLFTKKGKHFWKNFVLSKQIISKEEWEEANELPF